ncbi:Structure-specific endonuclease subunit SLX4 [Cladobotryum mycophilum]|uniref:Structure-specific endonuclease subunit SLX4 n=1 Tax=Cladobotryum mycophilum TaxID=491253 RepID=A0ABR0SK95_9HYPO
MASPNIVLSSPSGSPLRKSRFFTSSSPDLPSVNDIISQASKISPLKLSAKELAQPSETKTSTADAQNYSTTKESNATLCMLSPDDNKATEVEEASIIEISANAVPKARKPRRKKEVLEKPKPAPKHATSPTKGQPLKKLKSKDEATDKVPDASVREDKNDVIPAQGVANVEPVQAPASPAPKVSRKSAKGKTKKDDSEEPLQLESAMTRRLDWTPPVQKTPIILDSDSPALGEFHSPGGSTSMKSFEQLLVTYKCTDDMRQDIITTSDEDSSFLKKRKRIEMVATSVSNIATSVPAQGLDKSPMKQKAPKKKPRTITELATAAYRSESPLESTSTTASKEMPQTETLDENNKGKKTKAKPRKRASKNAKKKPSPPPKPILLPPAEALKEVANQNFLFGTSSQLAVENSPTFLRDLQLAMRNSNQLDVIDLETPLSSDPIEPLERRSKLWGAGARDADGELFDLEVTTIANMPSQKISAPPKDDDPFGYFQQEEKLAISDSDHFKPNSPQGDDPFIDTLDELPSFGLGLKEAVIDDAPFSDDQLSTGSPIRRIVRPPPANQPEKQSSANAESPKQHDLIFTDENEDEHQPSRPSYDLYTDAQLTKEVTSYGFKAVKSRKAKIALLEQCWQSKSRPSHPSIGQIAAVSTIAGQVAGNQAPVTPEGKKARGRPRKNSISASEPQEPPPSAQPPEPARPRGRPKKDPAASTKARKGTAVKKTKKFPTGQEDAPTTPKRKPKATTSQVFIEIPDSASDGESDLSGTPQSSPEPTFSPPPPVDLSLSLDDDTDPSLSLDTSEQSVLFAYITKAVTTAPRTTNPANPSWHEKILLYDPIILEDLTSWLNCGQLTRVGCDSEVNTGELKKWCESKSICCLWKVNLRGKERKRY